MSSEKQKTTIQVDAETFKCFTAINKALGTSNNAVLCEYMAKYVKEHTEDYEALLEAQSRLDSIKARMKGSK